MNPARVRYVLAKDLRLGPRSPLVLWALVLPVLATLLLRGVFGGLFDSAPSLGIVDEGSSAFTARMLAVDALKVVASENAAGLRRAVQDGGLDAGLVLPPRFDEALLRGERPAVQLWVSGQSLPAERAMLLITFLDLVRAHAGDHVAVNVEIESMGDVGLPLDVRLLPLLVVMAVAIAGAMVPAASLVEEKERGTLHALLVTPLGLGEALIAKALLGWILAMAAGTATLILNQAFGADPLVLLLAVALGGMMMAEVGLMLGSWAPDINTLFAAWKGGALVLIYPVVFFLWPELPAWIAQLGPTYYFLRPVFALSVEGASPGMVAGDLVVATLICLALAPLAALAGRRMEGRIGLVSTRS